MADHRGPAVTPHEYNARRIKSGDVTVEVLAHALEAYALDFQRGRPDLADDSRWGPKTSDAWHAECRTGDVSPFPRGHAAIIAHFGEGLDPVDDLNRRGWLKPDAVWIRRNIRSVEWRGHNLHLHRLCVDRFVAALEAALEASGFMPKRIGSLAQRRINRDPAAALSTHTVGAAIDIDAADNGYGVPLARTTLGQNIRFAQVMEEHGFCWGGRWRGRGVDAMHFQAGSPS